MREHNLCVCRKDYVLCGLAVLQVTATLRNSLHPLIRHAILYNLLNQFGRTEMTLHDSSAAGAEGRVEMKVFFSSLGVPLVHLILTTFMRNFIAIFKRVAVFDV